MEAGVARGSRVGDEFLIYLDPALPQPYRTQLIRGHELLAQGRRSGDVAKQTEGNELVRTFYQDFLPPKADAILAKMGVQPAVAEAGVSRGCPGRARASHPASRRWERAAARSSAFLAADRTA